MTCKTFRGLGWLSAVFCVGACNAADKTAEGHLASKLSNDGIESPITVAPKGTVAALTATQPTYGTATAAFLGTWTTRAESRYTNCASDTPVNELVGTTITWSAGATGHIQAELVGKCVLDAKVSGNVATAPDQTCNDNGISYVVGGTFTIQPDGTARCSEHVRATGPGVNCAGTVSGPFQKYVP